MNQAAAGPRALRIGIVGSGPAGWYAADALLKSGAAVTVDVFDRFPAPHGLVRYGVAPDHPEIKLVQRQFDRIAGAPEVSFFGNVEVGRDVAVKDMRRVYDALILATGMPRHRPLGIPGEDLPGSHGADAFVGWYNGHPDFCDREIDLSGEAAAVIGNGNVAIDVARILARSPDELRGTDIADHAARRLARSRIRTIYVIGRRGPAQAAFTAAELGELADLGSFAPIVDTSELLLEPACRRDLERDDANLRRKAFGVLERFSDLDRGERAGRIRFLFRRSPVAVEGAHRVQGLRLVRNNLQGDEGHRIAVPTDDSESVPCGLVVRCIGYKGVPLDGIPFDVERGTIPNESGLVLDPADGTAAVYAVGWIQHGPRGLIGTTKKESARVARSILEDLADYRPAGDRPEIEIGPLLDAHRVRFTSYDDWKTIDLAEQARGREAGKTREKFCSVASMLACLDAG